MKLHSFLLFFGGVASNVHHAGARLPAHNRNNDIDYTKKTRALERGKNQGLTVMTRNLFLGADISTIFSATSLLEIVLGVTTVWGDAVASNFELRMDAIADEIQQGKPDIVGLQEAYRFSVIDATGVSFSVDLADLVLQKLQDRGLSYSIKAFNENGAFQSPFLPTLTCDADKLIPATPQIPIPSCILNSLDFDVIIVNDDVEDFVVDTTATASGTYATQFVIPLPTGGVQDPKRGWSYFEGVFNGEERFRIVNTHLEVQDSVNQNQATELFQPGGPLYNVPEGTSVILLGDFNSAADILDPVPAGRTAFGSSAVGNILTLSDLEDAWEATPGGGPQQGFTFGQLSALDNRKDLSYARIDLIFFGPGFRVKPGSVKVVGQRSLSQNSLPYWASDHSGVVATMFFD